MKTTSVFVFPFTMSWECEGTFVITNSLCAKKKNRICEFFLRTQTPMSLINEPKEIKKIVWIADSIFHRRWINSKKKFNFFPPTKIFIESIKMSLPISIICARHIVGIFYFCVYVPTTIILLLYSVPTIPFIFCLKTINLHIITLHNVYSFY